MVLNRGRFSVRVTEDGIKLEVVVMWLAQLMNLKSMLKKKLADHTVWYEEYHLEFGL